MVYGEQDQKHGEVIAALVLPDAEAFIELSETKNIPITDDLMRDVISKEIAKVNSQVSQYKQIVRFHLRDREFEKTTTQKVKRYLVKKG
jgi:long-chain acyl-CoA synthetase